MDGAGRRAYAADVDLGLPGDDDPAVGRCGSAPASPSPERAATGRGRIRRAPLGPAFGLDADPVAELIIDEELRRAGATPREPHRQRLGRTYSALRRQRRAEGALALALAQRRGVLVPALLNLARAQTSPR